MTAGIPQGLSIRCISVEEKMVDGVPHTVIWGDFVRNGARHLCQTTENIGGIVIPTAKLTRNIEIKVDGVYSFQADKKPVAVSCETPMEERRFNFWNASSISDVNSECGTTYKRQKGLKRHP